MYQAIEAISRAGVIEPIEPVQFEENEPLVILRLSKKDRKSNGLSGSMADAGCGRQSPSLGRHGSRLTERRQMAPQALPDAGRLAAGGQSPCIRREPPLPHLPGDALIELDLRCGLG